MVVFTASDGTTFDDRNAWRKYEFETNYTFRNQKQQTLVKAPGKISGQPFDLSDLDDCEVLLLDQCDQVQVDNLTNCRVFIGPCSESVFVRNCTNCVFTVACKQLRTRDSTQCSFYLYSLTDPIIETSQQIHFAPFNGAYNGIERHFADARLEPTNNHWSQVYDFNDPDKSGDNWKLLTPQEEAAPWTVDLSGHVPDPAAFGPCVNPVARDSGFIKYTESNSSSSIASFSSATSQRDAEKAIESQTTGKEAATTTPATLSALAAGASTLSATVAPVPPAVAAPPPPPSVATFAGTATVVHFPPPAPLAAVTGAPKGLASPTALGETLKVAAVKPAEVLDPPPAHAVVPDTVDKALLPPLEYAGRSSATEDDGGAESAADMLEQLLNLGPATPAL
jgi:protein XRP2